MGKLKEWAFRIRSELWATVKLRRAVQSQRREECVVDKRCGRWRPKNRLNVDQATLPFVVEQDKTHKMLGNKQVWISQPGQEPNNSPALH